MTALLMHCLGASAATFHVWQDSPAPTPPYTDWTTAAHGIQDAVDAAVDGDRILVTDGVYSPITVNRGVTVESVNGAEVTIIDGQGEGRCATLGGQGVLRGFTLRNGNASFGGGVDGGTLYHCVLTGNSAGFGGASRGSKLRYCLLSSNSASASGGGVYEGTLSHCTLTANSAEYGGGAFASTLDNCALTGNTARYGGGALYLTLNNCTLTGNSASSSGGGAGVDGSSSQGWAPTMLNNCIVYFNTAPAGANYGSNSVLNYSCTTPLPGNGFGNIDLDPELASASRLSAGSPCRGAGSAAYATSTDIDGEPWAAPPSIGCDEYWPEALTGPLTVAIGAAATNVTAGFPAAFTARIDGRVSASSWDLGDGTVVSNRPFVTHTWTAAGTYVLLLTAFNETHPGGVNASLTVQVKEHTPVHYVAAGSASPTWPFASWATAAHRVQDAVDAAETGDTVLVTNGVYASGGRTLTSGSVTNRAFINKAITVASVNGPDVTLIVGAPATAGGNGSNAIRCAFLGSNAVLSGFTLTNGHAGSEYRGPAEPWWYEDLSGGGLVAAPSGTVSNCVITGNSALLGGGAAGGTLSDCALVGNRAEYGGGSYDASLSHCTLTANTADHGGGSCWGTLWNCSLTDNQADSWGGGSYGSTLYNSVLTGNTAGDNGGGAGYGALYNCTLTGNEAGKRGGGVYEAFLFNSLAYFNQAFLGANWFWDPARYRVYAEAGDSGPPIQYACTIPLPDSGRGNLADEPQLASPTHLSVNSPCRGAGSAEYAGGLDADGEPWSTPPSIGADEFVAGQVFGPLSVAIGADYTNVVVGVGVRFAARIQGRTTTSQWDMGDGTVRSDQPYVESHAWGEAGTYTVRLTAFNGTYPSGVSATVTVQVVEQPVFYVNQANPHPAFPYASWDTAATNIQDAIGASPVAGRRVWVTNGVYDTGGLAVWDSMTNRVALLQAVTVQSVNGPEATIIQGAAAPGGSNGDGAVRCAYVGRDSVLSGFTLTQGHTRTTGDTSRDRMGGGAWCESGGILTNCMLVANHAARDGGGADGGTLFDCAVTGNSADDDGGGTDDSILHRCTVSGNTAGDNGGGADEGFLYHCILLGNSAFNGGGVDDCTLYNCTLADNTAAWNAGGASGSTLYTCELQNNSASQNGGGAAASRLHNCTLTGNQAGRRGGGTDQCFMYNSIAYYNRAALGPNWYWDAAAYSFYSETHGEEPILYSCTTPLPEPGTGNLDDDPQLASPTHLAATSPCIRAGSAAFASGVDIDGEAWLMPPSMGADQFVPGAAAGPLVVSIDAEYTTVVAGFNVTFGARIAGHAATCQWELDDGTVLSNRPYISRAWQDAGLHTVRLSAFNDSHPEGVSAVAAVQVVAQPIFYVDQANISPVSPYDSWETAANTIQEAIEASAIPGRMVLVADGVYDTGGRAVRGLLTNRIVLNNSVTVQSVNGPLVTVIRGAASPTGTNGDGAVRCAYVGNGSTLSGFTLAHGHTRAAGGGTLEQSGGGAWCESSGLLTNCVLTGNHATRNGGGVRGGTLWNCLLIGNTAAGGGGVHDGALWNCAFLDNTALQGGAALESTLQDCWLSENSATFQGGGGFDCTIHDSTLESNSASEGGGAADSRLYYCDLIANSATGRGGGVSDCAVHDSALELNRAGGDGGGACLGTLDGCTLTSNSASDDGGGASRTTLRDCTLSANEADDNGGGSHASQAYNCEYDRNHAGGDGGGAAEGLAQNCWFSGNWAAGRGGGTSACTVHDSVLELNRAGGDGGGAFHGTLQDSTLASNSAGDDGGGAAQATLYRCALARNAADDKGGGSHNVQAHNCVFDSNSAGDDGGGANASSLFNCTLVANSAGDDGGGADESSLRNCVLFANIPTGATASTLLTCWTEGDPAFADYAAGNLRLQSNSPCVNAGLNAHVSSTTDLDGHRRIADGSVDLGAYEYQWPDTLLFDAWLQQFGLPTDGSADGTDPDDDQLNNWQEWRCGTDPTNALSVLRLLTVLPAENSVDVTWQSVDGVTYFLERSTNLAASPPFVPLATKLTGQAGMTTFSDTNAPRAVPLFYRVGVPAP